MIAMHAQDAMAFNHFLKDRELADEDAADLGSSTGDRVLDYLDEAPVVNIDDGFYVGPAATVQQIAAMVQVSETTARRAIRALEYRHLVERIEIFRDGGGRQLLIVGAAVNA